VKDVPKVIKPKIELICWACWEQCLPKKYVIVSTSENSLKIDVEIETTDTSVKHQTDALVDSGATGLFMDSDYVCLNAISTCQLSLPILVFNVDGSVNEAGEISEVVEVILWYDSHVECAQFVVTQLGQQNMILGFTWLWEHNPEVNWQSQTVQMLRCPPKCDTCCIQEKHARKVAEQICACHAGRLPELVDDAEDEEEDDDDLERCKNL
jgi:hypothetical protein